MSSGLRERKRQAVSDTLRRAALELFAVEAAELVTVERIAARADVSPRTFFNHFTTKEGVLHVHLCGARPDFLQRVADEPASLSAYSALLSVISHDLARLEESQREWGLWLQVLRQNPQFVARSLAQTDEIEQLFADAVALRTGQDPSEVYPRLAAGCALTIARATMGRVARSQRPLSVVHEFAAAAALVSSGLPQPL